jgi:methylthioribose-1-phosphate isomerase
VAEIQAIKWINNRLILLDQTKLPTQEIYIEIDHYSKAVNAIKEMRVRGAPALGITAAYGMALAALNWSPNQGSINDALTQASLDLIEARPTAVNIAWAVNRMKALVHTTNSPIEVSSRLLNEANRLFYKDIETNKLISGHGSILIKKNSSVLTHCNTGALATAGYGTALGVIRRAWEEEKNIQVFHTETRPFMQGARLTAWELAKLHIPTTMIIDSAVGILLRTGKVDCVITGADRIAANGDTANKIGTYTLAALAAENRIPFYIAAPTSTIDLTIPSGNSIPIEERRSEEITHLEGIPLTPEETHVWNPSFDVTPHYHISAIITETGVIRPPYNHGLAQAVIDSNE